MTVNELIEKLQKLTPEERELPVCNYSLLDLYAINEFEYYDEIVDEVHVDEITNPANSELTVGEKSHISKVGTEDDRTRTHQSASKPSSRIRTVRSAWP